MMKSRCGLYGSVVRSEKSMRGEREGMRGHDASSDSYELAMILFSSTSLRLSRVKEEETITVASRQFFKCVSIKIPNYKLPVNEKSI